MTASVLKSTHTRVLHAANQQCPKLGWLYLRRNYADLCREKRQRLEAKTFCIIQKDFSIFIPFALMHLLPVLVTSGAHLLTQLD